MSEPIRFRLNGREVEVAGVEPETTLLGWLRTSGLTGSKEGCAEGECGACAVAIVGTGPDGRTRYEAVNGCLVLLASVHGREVVSVEGIASGVGPSGAGADGAHLHPVQQAMAEAGGSQCGYCTPGFVVSLFAEYHRASEGPLDEESIAGNLCRCTGYRPIREAARKLATVRSSRTEADAAVRAAARLTSPAPPAAPLAYAHAGKTLARPTSLAGALELLARDPALTVVTGGTDLVVEVNQRHARFGRMLVLDGIEELRTIRAGDAFLELGAGVPLAHLEEALHGQVPMLDQLWPLFSSRLIRTRATLGGNLGTASPIGDSPPALLALDAELVLASVRGERTVPIADYFTGYRRTLRAPDELVRAVRIPRPLARIQRFYKVSKRRMDDISTVAAGFAIDTDASGAITRARLAYGGVAATPVRARRAEAALLGRSLDLASIRAAREAAAAELSPIDDHRGSARYRRAMIGSLLEKLVADLEGERVTVPTGP
jgi:xanthine dehydrogenase small subunit